MQVAVVEMNGYVSPRLAWCTHLRTAVIEAGHILQQELRAVPDHMTLVDLVNALALDVLVCGGIPPTIEAALYRRGLDVIHGVIGTADQVLQALARGALRSEDALSDNDCGPGVVTQPDGVARGGPHTAAAASVAGGVKAA